MQKEAAVEHIIQRLKSELSGDYLYHSVRHTQNVIEDVILMAENDQLDTAEFDLLVTAAAYHDSGFLLGSDNHENSSCNIAKQILPKFDYSPAQIDLICELIMSTKVPQNAQSKLAELLCDADLKYLAGDNYFEISRKLLLELNILGHDLDESKWINMQIGFLESHHFWTDPLRVDGQLKKEKLIVQLREMKSQAAS